MEQSKIIDTLETYQWLSWMFLGYKGIYRRKKYVGGATRGPRGLGHANPLGTPSTLVVPSWLHQPTSSSYIYLRTPKPSRSTTKT